MQVVRVDQRQQQSQQQQQTYPELFRLLTVGVNWDEIEDTLDFQQVNNEHSDHYGGEEEHADVVVDDDNNNNNDDDNNNNNASDGVYFVDAVTGRTALHLAVANEKERAKVIHRRCSQTLEATSNKGGEPTATTDATAVTGTPSSSLSRLRVIKKLVRAHPRAIFMRDTIQGYTPLAYACCAYALDLVTLTEDAQIVEVLLDAAGSHVCSIPIPVSTIRGGAAAAAAVSSMSTTTRRDCSPLCLHILTVSFLASCTSTLTSSSCSTTGPASITTAVLEALAAHATRAALEQALETLYVCNTHTILQMVAHADARARRNKLRFGRQTSSTVDHDCWIWDWVLTLLRFIHKCNCRRQGHQIRRPFQAMHVAAQVTDCPTPFVSLAMRAFPAQVRAMDQATLQLPHHMVASWYLNDGNYGDLDASSHGILGQDGGATPRSTCRQALAMSALTTEFPTALEMKNKSGQTPVELLKLSAAAVAAAAAATVARDDAATSTLSTIPAIPSTPSSPNSRSSPRSPSKKKSIPAPTVVLSSSFASPLSRSGRTSILLRSPSASSGAPSITSSPGGNSGVSRTWSGSSESRLPDVDNPFYG